jgi:PST family polysaccharide transporter
VSVAGSAGNFAVQIGSVVIVARLLTPSDFGVVTMVTTFFFLFRSFGLNGFTELIVQCDNLDHRLASNFFWMNLGIGTVLTFCFIGLAPVLAAFYGSPAITWVAIGISVSIAIGCAGYIHLGLLQRAMHFKSIAMINFVGQLTQVIVNIVLAITGFHYWALVWGSVAQTAVITLGTLLVCRWRPGLPRRTPGTEEGFKYAMNVYWHFAFGYMTRNTDNLLVGWRFGAQILGFYKKAYDLFVLPQNQLLSPIGAVAVSALSRIRHDREQFQKYFLQTISVLALLGVGIGTDFALVGGDIIRILLGPGWEDAGRIFALFGPGIGVMFLYNTHGWVHLSIGRAERWLRWGVLEFGVTITLFLFALQWGPSGIALAWTVSYFVLLFPGFWYAGKPIGMGIGPILAAIWRFFAASLLAAVGTVFVVRAIPGFAGNLDAVGTATRMVMTSVVFFALYLVGLIGLYRGPRPLVAVFAMFRELFPQAGRLKIFGTAESN